MNIQNWQYLIQKYLDASITREEFDTLLQLIDEQKGYAERKHVLQDYWDSSKGRQFETKVDWDKKLDELLAEAKEREGIIRMNPGRKINYFRWVAAASVIAILVASGYLFLPKSQPKPVLHVAATVKKDIAAPAKNNAILTLANGKMIVLDSATNGSLATQGNTRIDKLSNGQVVYTGKPGGEIQYNTLTVPRGSKIASITLSDGTRVWLNSASSLTYPVAFAGNERKVEITGEAYFEVTRNQAMPFKVQKGETVVTVLGTRFDVNAYQDEASIKITLLQGLVKVDLRGLSKLLKPNQQAQISSGIRINDDIDVEEVMAWKNGEFQFGEAADINSIMRQISRWYDVSIEYKGDITGHIGGTISRGESVAQVLKMLEMTGAVRFEIEGNIIIVSSNHL